MRLLTASLGLAALALGATGCAGEATGSTDEYPRRPVTILNPYAAGGASDTTARAFGACLSSSLGGTFAVENKVGGAGAVAMQDLVAAKSDGYKLALSTNGPMVLNPMTNALGYELEDFRSFGIMAEIPTMFAVPANSPYKDFDSLIAAAKANPDTISMAVPGATDSPAIELKRLQQESGIRFSIVPTTGSAEIITQLMGGHVDAAYLNDYTDAEAQVKAGKFKILAAAGDKRSEAYPKVPSTKELGYDIKTTSVYGLFAPKGVPDEIAAKLESGVQECSKDPKVIEQIGDRFVPDEFTNGPDTTTWFDSLRTRYATVLGK